MCKCANVQMCGFALLSAYPVGTLQALRSNFTQSRWAVGKLLAAYGSFWDARIAKSQRMENFSLEDCHYYLLSPPVPNGTFGRVFTIIYFLLHFTF